MSETLGQKQERFARLFAELILHAFSLGYTVRIGEVERSKAQAQSNAASGRGIANSLHLIRLAGDLHLFKDGKYLADTESHRQLGEWWEERGGSWGGRFGDGNHYSIAHEGRK